MNPCVLFSLGKVLEHLARVCLHGTAPVAQGLLGTPSWLGTGPVGRPAPFQALLCKSTSCFKLSIVFLNPPLCVVIKGYYPHFTEVK